MKIVIIRHGDPDYVHDTLTEKGWREAELLSDRIAQMEVKDFYVSPLGRAQDTASLTLKKMGRTAVTKDWLREFDPRIIRPDRSERQCAWDWMPADWTQYPAFYQYDQWYDQPVMQEAHVKERYEWVVQNFDALLEQYGYVRDGRLYHTEQGNHDTIVLFCHFGVECVLLSHLLCVSPMILWHGMVAAPTGVSEIVSEERQQGIVSFRLNSFSDTSHLYVGHEKVSMMARYRECFSDSDPK